MAVIISYNLFGKKNNLERRFSDSTGSISIKYEGPTLITFENSEGLFSKVLYELLIPNIGQKKNLNVSQKNDADLIPVPPERHKLLIYPQLSHK